MQELDKDEKYEIKYEIRKSSRARNLRLTIYPGGKMVATLPRRAGLDQLEGFILQKADWIRKKILEARKRGQNGLLTKTSRREYMKLKEDARKLAVSKLREHNQIYNFSYNRIAIRNQKTRWGSCSQKGNLNFNYKIIHLPEKHLDYIIVHELCHLKELNHSVRFWNLVEKIIPDYKKIRKELRQA
ncbi:MAG: M48 family metallopeptidase [Parcubacteria group bacterium]